MSVTPTILELKNIDTLAKFYRAVEQSLNLKGFGRNLDALYDSLSTDVPGPLIIRWLDASQSSVKLGENYKNIIHIFEQVMQERGDMMLELA